MPAAEPTNYRLVEIQLRKALAKSEALLLEKDELIHRQELLKEESDHRLLNDLQMTISLLSLQSRNSANPEAAAQLAAAANRVSMIARIHHRLNSYEGVRTIEFKKFLEDFCRDFSAMLSSDESPGKITVEGSELNLPATTAIPLGFIANELITNAAKYGKGRIAVRLESDPKHGCALSVANDGPALPEGFDPNASKGLGMRIIRSFTSQIGGELRIGRGVDVRARDLPCGFQYGREQAISRLRHHPETHLVDRIGCLIASPKQRVSGNRHRMNAAGHVARSLIKP